MNQQFALQLIKLFLKAVKIIFKIISLIIGHYIKIDIKIDVSCTYDTPHSFTSRRSDETSSRNQPNYSWEFKKLMKLWSVAC